MSYWSSLLSTNIIIPSSYHQLATSTIIVIIFALIHVSYHCHSPTIILMPYEWMKPSFSSQHSIALRPWAQRAYFERQKSTTHSRPGAWDVGTSGRGPRGMPGFFWWEIHGKSMENPWKSIKRDEQSMKISIWLIFFGWWWLEDLFFFQVLLIFLLGISSSQLTQSYFSEV